MRGLRRYSATEAVWTTVWPCLCSPTIGLTSGVTIADIGMQRLAETGHTHEQWPSTWGRLWDLPAAQPYWPKLEEMAWQVLRADPGGDSKASVVAWEGLWNSEARLSQRTCCWLTHRCLIGRTKLSRWGEMLLGLLNAADLSDPTY